MLSNEQAREQLAQYRTTDETFRTIRAKPRASALARNVAAAMNDSRLPTTDLCARLDELDDRKRAAVFAAMVPEMSRELAATWTWGVDAPYQQGWMRRGYRSSNPADSAQARWHMVRSTLYDVAEFAQPLSWHVRWHQHAYPYGFSMAAVFATAIINGHSAIAEELASQLRGEHEICGPSRVAYSALLAVPEPRYWQLVAENLVAAQRSEGLRQVILESADLAHPGGLRTLLQAVADHGLIRFAATVRAVGVWVGEELTVAKEREVAGLVAAMIRWLDEYDSSTDDLAHRLLAEPALDVFVGLWACALHDIVPTIDVAAQILAHGDPGQRLAAARMLRDINTPTAAAALSAALGDPDPAVFAVALGLWNGWTDHPLPPEGIAALDKRLPTLGKPTKIDVAIIGENTIEISQSAAADVLVTHGTGLESRWDIIDLASPVGRRKMALRFCLKPATYRSELFAMLADKSADVRKVVGGSIEAFASITDDEARQIEKYLTRKSADVRTIVLRRLQSQEPDAVAASIARLESGTAEQKRAAQELRESAQAETEATFPAVLTPNVELRTPAVRPTPPDPAVWAGFHDRCLSLITSLKAFFAEHAETEVKVFSDPELLVNLRWIPSVPAGQVPLAEVFGPWWERVQPTLTEGGVELELLAAMRHPDLWTHRVSEIVVGSAAVEAWWELPRIGRSFIYDLSDSLRHRGWVPVMLDHLETMAAALDVGTCHGSDAFLAHRGIELKRHSWGSVAVPEPRSALRNLLEPLCDMPEGLSDAQRQRLWASARFVDEPEGAYDEWNGPRVPVPDSDSGETAPDRPFRVPASQRLVADVFTRGLATRDDLLEALVRPDEFGGRHSIMLHSVTRRRPDPWATAPRLQEVVDEVRSVVLDIEFERGDLPTPVTYLADRIRTVYGAANLVRAVAALGKRPFVRGYVWTTTRESILSQLVRGTWPDAEDTAATLGAELAAAGVSVGRQVEVAVYAPQWAALIEQHLGLAGLESAVWWIHAHTKDSSWSVDADTRSEWTSEVSQRTPLAADDLVNGATDVAWFTEMLDTLGEKEFRRILAAGKYASSAGGHKRAELFATALLASVTTDELQQRISTKRHQDSVRALGLVPLAGESDLLARYELISDFVRSDRTSGSQRRASERTAMLIGLDNLARTAGYRDPQRLRWAMETAAVKDLMAGPISATDGDLEVSLSVDAEGNPELQVRRGAKTLAAVPTKSAKVPEIAALRQRAAELRSQRKRMRRSLEDAAVLGDPCEPGEIAALAEHPIIAPMLADLVMVDSEGFVGFFGGSDGTTSVTLMDGDGQAQRAMGAVRVAHPIDLLASGEWPALQHAVMAQRRTQPFKQLFRELYTLNANERDEAGIRSRRYAGHQVQPAQARALFTERGWVADQGSGYSRTFHAEKLTAWVMLDSAWGTPGDVELPTLGNLYFVPSGTNHPVVLDDVAPRVFSEVMRDLDLVVSVAHAGGVDPQTSESSIEVRARLVAETAEMLSLDNVDVGAHHVLIEGSLGRYSIHLGSGQVHLLPGNAVCIIAVSAQHRGRVFLPFADDDPRTAEIISKVVLLARDSKITDPTILEQLVGRAS
ncbi:DUF4132 domain-containing protein [Williamsia sp. CHRR-6]|uniref:DUF4132 domain-containing protein n=1 Tax=Williamsia sp. CHRR-6 TaxID=2835871 RepID=UPI001BD939EB|nr:DUF4132 domain-containing protein [Williamsia sp. CHRR-6]MBT0566199.1 DUF4132 domain-containing protein [Williamsia sp. CHRR-6]